MSDSSDEKSYSKRHKKHSRKNLSPELGYEHRKKHRSHKRKSNEQNDGHKKRQIRSEPQEYVKVTTEDNDTIKKIPRKRYIKTEPQEQASGSINESNSEHHTRRGEEHEWGERSGREKAANKTGEVQKPNFSLSGKLAEDTNIYNGVVIKYSEPPEARMPKKRWRLYPFKGDQGLPTLYIHRQSAYLLGRDRKVVDIPIDHPSCSKQHAALQYRQVSYQRPNGSLGKQIRLYLIDLESANGTYINNNKIESKKYVELFEKDVIKFGYSSREYVLLHEHSKDDSENDS